METRKATGKPIGFQTNLPAELLRETLRNSFEKILIKETEGRGSLSENQFGFRKSRSTLQAIQCVIRMSQKPRTNG